MNFKKSIFYTVIVLGLSYFIVPPLLYLNSWNNWPEKNREIIERVVYENGGGRSTHYSSDAGYFAGQIMEPVSQEFGKGCFSNAELIDEQLFFPNDVDDPRKAILLMGYKCELEGIVGEIYYFHTRGPYNPISKLAYFPAESAPLRKTPFTYEIAREIDPLHYTWNEKEVGWFTKALLKIFGKKINEH